MAIRPSYQVRSGAARFGAGFDAVEHLALHHEVERLDDVPQQPLAGTVGAALPDDEAGLAPTVERLEEPLPGGCGVAPAWDVFDHVGHPDVGWRPRALEHQVVGSIDLHDRPADVVVLAGADDVAHRRLLVLGKDPVDAVDVAATRFSSAS